MPGLARDEFDIEVRLLPRRTRVRNLVAATVGGLLSWGPTSPKDSHLVIVRRGTGEVVGTIPLDHTGDVHALLRSDADTLTPEEFVARWGLDA